MAKRKWVFYMRYMSYPRVTWSCDPPYHWWRGLLWNIVDGINHLGCQSPLWQRNGTFRSMSRSCKRSSKRCVRLQWTGEKLSLWKRKLTSIEDFHNVASADSNCVCGSSLCTYTFLFAYTHLHNANYLCIHTYIYIWILIYVYIHHMFKLNIYIFIYLFLSCFYYRWKCDTACEPKNISLITIIIIILLLLLASSSSSTSPSPSPSPSPR